MRKEDPNEEALGSLGYVYSLVASKIREDDLALDILNKTHYSRKTIIQASIAIAAHVSKSLTLDKLEFENSKELSTFESSVFFESVFLDDYQDTNTTFEAVELLSRSKLPTNDIILPPLVYLIGKKAEVMGKSSVIYSEELCKSLQYIKNISS